ncbi:MAG: hypothetical protein IAF02_21760, partial [Anaerolineae bacterium]|nr:hypothetical protein [Anaerolineae bacterium]
PQVSPQRQEQPAPSAKPHPGQPAEHSETALPTAETAVSQPVPTTATTEAIQRAIAAAEAPSTPPFIPKSSTPQTHTIPKATTTLSPQMPPTVSQPSPDSISKVAVSHSHEAQIQRATASATAAKTAIALAEKPSTRTSQAIQRTPTASQTAVSATTSTLFQDLMAENWQVDQETAVIPPETHSPTITTTTVPSIMRALAAVESKTADETKASPPETYQWPDIMPVTKPMAAPPIQHNIQRIPDEVNPEPEIESSESPATIDINQLANEVYSQLKKRLAIEWERGRGKR